MSDKMRPRSGPQFATLKALARGVRSALNWPNDLEVEARQMLRELTEARQEVERERKAHSGRKSAHLRAIEQIAELRQQLAAREAELARVRETAQTFVNYCDAERGEMLEAYEDLKRALTDKENTNG